MGQYMADYGGITLHLRKGTLMALNLQQQSWI
jgi:hypothetical protein